MPRSLALLTALLFSCAMVALAQNACNLNGDSVVDVKDVTLASAMARGAVPCTATVAGTGVCTETVMERVKSAALPGGVCVRSRSVELNWQPSPTTGVGYNVYRRLSSGTQYTKLNTAPLSVTTYMDSSVQFSTTYVYVVRAVNGSGVESVNSNEVQAAIPAS